MKEGGVEEWVSWIVRYLDSSREVIAASLTFNKYEERDGVWKIAYREVIRDWIAERLVDKELFTGGFAMELSKPDDTDKSYEVLSLFGRGPLERGRPRRQATARR